MGTHIPGNVRSGKIVHMQYKTCEELLLNFAKLRHLNDMLLELNMQEVLHTLTQALRPGK